MAQTFQMVSRERTLAPKAKSLSMSRLSSSSARSSSTSVLAPNTCRSITLHQSASREAWWGQVGSLPYTCKQAVCSYVVAHAAQVDGDVWAGADICMIALTCVDALLCGGIQDAGMYTESLAIACCSEASVFGTLRAEASG